MIRLLLLLFTLTACTSQNSKPVPADNFWRLQGKLGIRTEEARHSARLDWRQNGSDYSIQLSGPFGAGAVKIDGNKAGVTLHQAGQTPLAAESASELLQQSLGWILPVEAASYWVRARPAPGSEAEIEKNEQGLVMRITQLGWQFDYRYRNTQPYRVKLTPLGYDTTLTLIIKQWQLLPPQS
jgi:outer membrane lipoprotein LolB